jgi:murein DD-endopeptidase MepM/ murein hydrolase activator NlpD
VAGQQVAVSGDTGRSGAPHLHIELHINGVQYCPQPVMQALYNGSSGPFTWAARGCSF